MQVCAIAPLTGEKIRSVVIAFFNCKDEEKKCEYHSPLFFPLILPIQNNDIEINSTIRQKVYINGILEKKS
jgi:hypothetical protein